jgi:hypothetical protein
MFLLFSYDDYASGCIGGMNSFVGRYKTFRECVCEIAKLDRDNNDIYDVQKTTLLQKSIWYRVRKAYKTVDEKTTADFCFKPSNESEWSLFDSYTHMVEYLETEYFWDDKESVE